MIRIEDVAFDFAMKRKVGFDFDRDKRVGASEVGQCSRKTAYKKLRTPPDPGSKPTSGFAVRGDVMEDNWIAPLCREWIKANGGELLYSGQADQISFAGKNTVLSATPDGLAVGVARDILKEHGVPDIGKSKALVLEMKSIDPRYGKGKLPKSPHIPQTLTQLGMIRHATKHRPEWGAIVYVDASDYFDIPKFPVQWDEKKFKGLVNRASKLLSAKDPNQFPPEGKIAGGSQCNECEFVKRCLGFVPWLAGDDPRAPKAKQVAEVEKAAARVHQAKERLAELQQDVRDREADLYGVLNAVGRKFVIGKKFTVSAKATSSQQRDDVDAMKAAMKKKGLDPEGYKKATKPGTSISVEANA